jgi:hypothetical protein
MLRHDDDDKLRTQSLEKYYEYMPDSVLEDELEAEYEGRSKKFKELATWRQKVIKDQRRQNFTKYPNALLGPPQADD